MAWVVLGLGGAAAAASGPWTDRVGPRLAWTTTVAVVAVSTAMLAAVPGRAVPPVLACAGFGWGFVAATGALIGWTLSLDADRAARGTGLLFVVLVLGQALGATGIGAVVASAGYPSGFGVAAALGLVAVLPAMPVRRRRAADAATRGRPRAGRARSRRCG